ncbi:hypothetical protein pipiens_016525, partial [Culex pipiens pipiens]
ETLNSLRPEVTVKREIRLNSAGLSSGRKIRKILKRNSIANLEEELVRGVYRKLYDTLIAELDGIDNGVPMFEGAPKYTSARTFPSALKRPKLTSERISSTKFLYNANRWWPARAIVEKAVRNRLKVLASGDILEQENFCPWKEHLYKLEGEQGIAGLSMYVIYFKRPNDWRVICVPLELASFVCCKFLARKWRGERDDKLEEISGIKGANFCHQTGFNGGNRTREGALRMTVASLEEK